MRALLVVIVLLISSCTNNDLSPKRLAGSWQMVTNNNIDMVFDIVAVPQNSDYLYVTNVFVRFNGITSTPSTPSTFPVTLTGNLYTFIFHYNASGTDNIASLLSGTVNSQFNQISLASGWVSVAGFNSSVPPPYQISLTGPIILNRTR
jgi:hypothetical protein